MNQYDTHHQAHPSQSIPDAAYPDSSYRPSDGPHEQHELSTINTSMSGLSSTSIPSPPQQQPYLQPHQQPYLQPHPHQQSYHASQNSLTGGMQTYTTTPTSPNHSPPTNSPWESEPLGPPPPYVPSQTPSFYSPLSAPAPTHPSSSSSNLQIHTEPPGSSSGHYAPPSPYSMQSSHFPSSPEPGYVKYGPIAEARRRRKRKMQICLMAMCFMFLFFIALILGIALGVMKVTKDRGHDDDYS